MVIYHLGKISFFTLVWRRPIKHIALKPAIHLYSIPSICPNTVFFPPIQVEKSGTSFHVKFRSALAVGESHLLSPFIADLRSHYSSPTQRISDFLPSKRGANLDKSFDIPLASFEISNGNRRMKHWNLISLEFHRFE
ncbi:hypothetical protein AVEN_13243-1 [Araneus ventricosus]|uniref:Uncharacterized protein n=1 Tax=Araneus ventricosus TaxID=182803 RepID=A0A4Y2DMX6_ARAVE|nr:hypothetical protein AVEN_13243-1 [Araneus ventricosus]